MVSDDDLQNKTNSAVSTAIGHLKAARAALTGAHKSFEVSPWWWGTLGERLLNHSVHKADFKELRDALKAAEDAIGRAENACNKLGR